MNLRPSFHVQDETLKWPRPRSKTYEGQLSQSSAKTNELQGKLSDSVPRAELETVKGELQSKIAGLEGKLSESKGEADALKEKLAGLESRAAEAQKELAAARNRIKDLEAAAAKPPTEEKPSEPVGG